MALDLIYRVMGFGKLREKRNLRKLSQNVENRTINKNISDIF